MTLSVWSTAAFQSSRDDDPGPEASPQTTTPMPLVHQLQAAHGLSSKPAIEPSISLPHLSNLQSPITSLPPAPPTPAMGLGSLLNRADGHVAEIPPPAPLPSTSEFQSHMAPTRRSTRVKAPVTYRVAPQIDYVETYAPVPKKRKSDASKSSASKTKPSVSSSPNSESPANPHKPLIVSLRVGKKNAVSPPTFEPLYTTDPAPLVWLKLALRDFLIRFYKSVAVAIMRLVYNDSSPVVEYEVSSAYLTRVEKSAAEDSNLWTTLQQYLDIARMPDPTDPSESSILDHPEVPKCLQLIRLIQLAVTTDTVRNFLAQVPEEQKRLKAESNADSKKVATAWHDLAERMTKAKEKLSSEEVELWKERYDSAHQAMRVKLRRIEDTLYQANRRLTIRTAPLGTDPAGNVYWQFQQRSRDKQSPWANSIVCHKSSKLIHPAAIPGHEELALDTSEWSSTDCSITCVNNKEDMLKLLEWIKDQERVYMMSPAEPFMRALNNIARHTD